MKYWYAYRTIALPSVVVTCIATYEFIKRPSLAGTLVLFWIKLITLAILVAYVHFFRNSISYFFMNLGVGRLRFYGSIVTIDLSLFAISLWVISIFI